MRNAAGFSLHNPLRPPATIWTDHGPAPSPPTLQDYLPPLFLHHLSLHPGPLLAGLLLLATPQAQKDLDSPPHDHDTDSPEIRTVALQGRDPHQP